MVENFPVLLIFGLLIAALSVAAGIIIANLMAEHRKKDLSEMVFEEETVQGRDPGDDGLPNHQNVLLTVLREPLNNQLIIKLGDKMYAGAAQMKGEAKEDLQKLMLELGSWMGINTNSSTDDLRKEMQPPVPERRADPKVAINKADQNIPGVAKAPLSIVEQINDIIQEMLPNSSAANHGVRLVEDPVAGVVVWVDLDRYIGIDAVKDQDVLSLIRSAVKQWEQSAGK